MLDPMADGPGRPELPPEEKRSVQLGAMFRQSEADAIREIAEEEGVSVSDLIRDTLLRDRLIARKVYKKI